MDLKILMMILLYYGILSSVIFFANNEGIFNEIDSIDNLNDTELSSTEIDTGGAFGTGISFSRFALLVTTGYGLPDDTPSWFSVIFILWQSIFTIFCAGWLISSIWDG